MNIADKIMFFCWASMMALLLLCDCFTYDEKLAYVLIMTTLVLLYFIDVFVKERR